MSTVDKRTKIVPDTPYPAPSPLRTPTDLQPQQVRAVLKVINPILADTVALYLKYKNFHWHVSGSHFRDYHLLFEEQAESLLAGLDPLAERTRKIGGTTLRSVSHVTRLQTIEDDNDDYVPPHEMIRRLLVDNRHVAEAQRNAINTCEEQRDTPTANLLQELLDETERRIWFLHEVLEGAGFTS